METQKLSNQHERKLSIDSEPRTLTKEELDKARAAAEAFISRDGQGASSPVSRQESKEERRRRGSRAPKLVAANAKAAKTKPLLNQYNDIPSINDL